MNNIKLDISGELLEFKSALVGGTLKNSEESPIAFYGGALNLDEIHTALYNINRAVVKLVNEEFNIPFENVDDFLFSAVSEAITKEYNNKVTGKSDIISHKVVKHYNKNQ